MKTNKIITIITIIFLVLLISSASFFGIYKFKNYKVKNIIPDYILGKEISKSRVVELEVDNTVNSTKIFDKEGNEITEPEEDIEYSQDAGYTIIEDRVNSREILTEENYEQAKKVISKRLYNLGMDEYTINLNKQNGSINLDIAENDKTDEIIEILTEKGTFEILDSQTQEVLLNNSNIKTAKPNYQQLTNGYVGAFLNIEFKKDAKSKLEEMNKTYVKTTEQVTNDEGQIENKEVSKDVSIKINGQSYKNAHFGNKTIDEIMLSGNTISILIGAGKDNVSIKMYEDSLKSMCVLINNGVMPIVYTQTNYVKDNNINIFQNKIIISFGLALILLAFVFLLIKLKLKGILAMILNIRICWIIINSIKIC